jgi:hypothetical protein
MKWLQEHVSILNSFIIFGKGIWCIDRNMLLLLRQNALERTSLQVGTTAA